MPRSRGINAYANNDNTGHVRREYDELHPKDRQIKQTKKLCIEKNWNTSIDHCLPAHVAPRIEIKKGAKARVDHAEVDHEVWWNWSVEFLKALEELSTMTEGDVGYARRLLTVEVEGRQANPHSTQRKVLEVLLGDVQKVVDEQRKRLAAGYHAEVMKDVEQNKQHDRTHYYSPAAGRRPDGPARKKIRQSMTEHEDLVLNFPSTDQDYIGTDTGPTIDSTILQPVSPGMLATNMQADHSMYMSPSVATTTAGIQDNHTSATPTTPSILSELLQAAEMKSRAAKLRMDASRLEYDAALIAGAYADKALQKLREHAAHSNMAIATREENLEQRPRGT